MIVLEDKRGCNNLLVVFGGVRNIPGMPIPEFQKITADINIDRVFVSDPHTSWYNKNGMYFADELLNAISNYDRTVFMGNSMGGYGALLWGTILDIEKVIAFSPQVFISQFLRRAHNDNRWEEYISKMEKAERLDLHDAIPLSAQTICKVYYSMGDSLDHKHIQYLMMNTEWAQNHLFTIPFEYNDHALVTYLKADGLLKRILDNELGDFTQKT